MKFSEQWLRSWVNPQVSREELFRDEDETKAADNAAA